ncbi:MAG: tetratricopeptide repeat protein [Cyanobacteria bacterium P01_F01_bin.153]
MSDSALASQPESQPMSISFCLIAKNEAANLARCLDSVRELCSELVVIDTGSTDGTVMTAVNLGARVSFFEWCDDFAAARNYGLEQLTGDWVLMLDGDEWLLPGAIPLIREAVTLDDGIAINLLRQEIGAAQSPYSLVSRLFRRHPAVRFERPYHALIDDSVTRLMAADPHWRVLSLPSPAIAHEGYQQATISSGNKQVRARKAMEAYLADHPEDAYVCCKLGALLADETLDDGSVDPEALGRSRKLLKQGLRQAERENNAELLYELHYHLAIVDTQRGNPDLAQSHYRVALKQPVLPMVRLGAEVNLGNLYQQAGRLDEAVSLYQSAIQTSGDLPQVHYNLGLALRAKGDLNGAIAAYQQAATLDPDRAEVHQNLGAALLKGGNVPASLEAFGQAISLYQEQGQEAIAEAIKENLAAMGFQPST